MKDQWTYSPSELAVHLFLWYMATLYIVLNIYGVISQIFDLSCVCVCVCVCV